MSPEQACGTHPLDVLSDLFSLGVMLFETLLGALPFPGQDSHRVVRSISEEEPPDPCRLKADRYGIKPGGGLWRCFGKAGC